MESLPVNSISFRANSKLPRDIEKVIRSITLQSRYKPRPNIKLAEMANALAEKFESRVDLTKQSILFRNASSDYITFTREKADDPLRITITLHNDDIRSSKAIDISAFIAKDGAILHPRSHSYAFDIDSPLGAVYDVISRNDCRKRIRQEIKYIFENLNSLDPFISSK